MDEFVEELLADGWILIISAIHNLSCFFAEENKKIRKKALGILSGIF